FTQVAEASREATCEGGLRAAGCAAVVDLFSGGLRSRVRSEPLIPFQIQTHGQERQQDVSGGEGIEWRSSSGIVRRQLSPRGDTQDDTRTRHLGQGRVDCSRGVLGHGRLQINRSKRGSHSQTD
ncbi:unnamed protein product, partial [Scytosiphon promiscuus]